MKNTYIGQAWLVILLSCSFGAALATVQSVLNPKIEANRLQDTIGQIPNLVPGAASGDAETIGEHVVYRARDEQGAQVGWVLPASGQGFADKISLLVGVDKEVTRITGLYILDQKETPGLGNRIVEDDWRRQFVDRPLAKMLTLVKAAASTEDEIQGVTGATISSESVVGIVNATVARFRTDLSGQGSK